jgi:hypothetical protein
MSWVAFGGSCGFAFGGGAGRDGLYRRIERSEEPVRIYVDGDEEYVIAWTGPEMC